MARWTPLTHPQPKPASPRFVSRSWCTPRQWRRYIDLPIVDAPHLSPGIAAHKTSLRVPAGAISACRRCEIRCHLRSDVDECVRWSPDIHSSGVFGCCGPPRTMVEVGVGSFLLSSLCKTQEFAFDRYRDWWNRAHIGTPRQSSPPHLCYNFTTRIIASAKFECFGASGCGDEKRVHQDAGARR
jgi:hypothetical protein